MPFMPSLIRRQRAAVLLPLLILVGAAASGCDLVTAEFKSKETAEWRKTYQLRPGGRVEIRNVNGKIEVTPSTDNSVEVVAVKTARGATPEAAKAHLERIEIREEAGEGGIKIETKVASGMMNMGSSEVQYKVKVPASAEVRFTTVNGGIELSGLAGQVNAEATNGGIRARDVAGPIEASTTNGGVDVELTQVAQPGVNLECTNGGIKLRLPTDAKATITASVTNGGIGVTEFPGFETTESTRRRLEARLNGGGPNIRLSGTNGGIQISPR
jgi:DUF4097 and DUF4098 domain-containing protein YvlB